MTAQSHSERTAVPTRAGRIKRSLVLILVVTAIPGVLGCKSLNATTREGAARYADQHFRSFAATHQEEARIAKVRESIPKGPDSLFAEY